MARGFGSTDGSGNSDKIATGFTPGSITAYVCWIWITGIGGGGFGRIFDCGAESCYYYDNAGTLSIQLFSGWSTGGSWDIAAPSTGAWHHLAVAYNSGATTNDPFFYLDGSLQTIIAEGTPSGTHPSPGVLNIGNRGSPSNRVWNGRIAEFAAYDGSNATRALDFIPAFAAGYTPIHCPGWSTYVPLLRDNVDRVRAAPTVTGTAIQPHPRTIYRSPDPYSVKPAATAYTLAVDTGSYSITGATSTLQADRLIAAVTGSYSITGSNSALEADRLLAALAGSYSLTGSAATVQADRLISAATGQYDITGLATTLQADRILAVDTGVYILTGADATMSKSIILAAATGSYSISGANTSLLATRLMSAAAGSYTITGANAALKYGRYIAAEPGEYLVTGNNVSLIRAYVLAADGGVYAITGSDATLTYTPVGGGGPSSSFWQYSSRKRRR